MTDEFKKIIAQELGVANESQVHLGMNLKNVVKFLSESKDLKRVLTSDSENYDFKDLGGVDIKRTNVLPLENFGDRFLKEASTFCPDVIFLSHSFFNSGLIALDLEQLIQSLSPLCQFLIIDGRQTFLHSELNIANQLQNVWYIGGMGSLLEFAVGKNLKETFAYPIHTLERCSLPKLDAHFTSYSSFIHLHTKSLQTIFRDNLIALDHPYLCEKNILSVDYDQHGPALVFAMPSPVHANKVFEEFKNIFFNISTFESRLIFDFNFFKISN